MHYTRIIYNLYNNLIETFYLSKSSHSTSTMLRRRCCLSVQFCKQWMCNKFQDRRKPSWMPDRPIDCCQCWNDSSWLDLDMRMCSCSNNDGSNRSEQQQCYGEHKQDSDAVRQPASQPFSDDKRAHKFIISIRKLSRGCCWLDFC